MVIWVILFKLKQLTIEICSNGLDIAIGDILLVKIGVQPMTTVTTNLTKQSGASISYHTILGEFVLDFLIYFSYQIHMEGLYSLSARVQTI